MIAGHAALAFAIVGAGAIRLGFPSRRGLLLALAAAGFALVPDVDMAYAVVGVIQTGPSGVWSATEVFWGSSQAVHRLATHSLVVLVVATPAFAMVTRAGRDRWVASALLAGIVVLGGLASGPLAAATLVLFGVAGAAVGTAAARAGLDARAVLAVAAVGLLTHPFGDVFTGTSPALFYPLDLRVLPARVALHPDPTVNLLAVFGLELATLWMALRMAATLRSTDLRRHLDPRGAVGAAYALTALVMPPPTLDVSYHFVFSVLAVGTVGVVPLSRPLDRTDVVTATVTGLGAVTLAGVGYTLVYLLA